MNRTQGIAALAAITLGALVGGAAFSRLQAAPGVFAQDVGATHDALSRTGTKLSEVAANGDAPAAARMLDEVTLMTRQLNDSPVQTQAMRSCQLAASHLGRGVVALSGESAWEERPMFEAALAQCH